MTDERTEAAAERAQEATRSHLLPQLGMMLRVLLASRARNTLFALGSALFVVVAATAYAQLRLNRWNQPFYDALSYRDVGRFIEQLGAFALITGTLLALNVAQRWLGEMTKLKLREGLVHDLLQHWLRPGRAFRLAHAGPIGENPDQRMHEDARHLTELSADLGIALLQACMLLLIFAHVLWVVSSGFSFDIGGTHHLIPGYMVWTAVFYAGSASFLTYRVGGSLVPRNAERYAREADLRFSLVRVNEHIDAIALEGGEAGEAEHLELNLARVLRALRALVSSLTNLTWITAGYGWFTLVAPIVAAAPLYFKGNLSFGGLMMAAGAFNQVQSSLRWFVDNFSTVADWRATLLRVADFRSAVLATDELHDMESRIAFVDGDPGKILIEALQIASPSGCTKLAEERVEITAGERVLVVGEPGVGTTLLFRALTGLWPWGAGRIARPRSEEMLYMARTPYIPPGTLRELLAYPSDAGRFSESAYTQVLTRLGLQRFVALLDEPLPRADARLSEEEEQSLAFARAVLRAPHWLLIDDLFRALDPETQQRLMQVLAQDLPHTGVIHVGRTAAGTELFTRVLHLVEDSTMRRLPGDRSRDLPAARPRALRP